MEVLDLRLKYAVKSLVKNPLFKYASQIGANRAKIKTAYCTLPGYEFEEVIGFTQTEIQFYRDYIASLAHVIMDLARSGGFQDASGF